MGFFDKILKGLGFEDEEEHIQKEPKEKVKKNKKQKSVTATFNLNELETDNKKESTQEVQQSSNSETHTNPASDFEVIKVATQTEVQQVINKLKNGNKILLNTEELVGQDLVRSLDFLTGAVFALNLKMQKLDEKLYLIQ